MTLPTLQQHDRPVLIQTPSIRSFRSALHIRSQPRYMGGDKVNSTAGTASNFPRIRELQREAPASKVNIDIPALATNFGTVGHTFTKAKTKAEPIII